MKLHHITLHYITVHHDHIGCRVLNYLADGCTSNPVSVGECRCSMLKKKRRRRKKATILIAWLRVVVVVEGASGGGWWWRVVEKGSLLGVQFRCPGRRGLRNPRCPSRHPSRRIKSDRLKKKKEAKRKKKEKKKKIHPISIQSSSCFFSSSPHGEIPTEEEISIQAPSASASAPASASKHQHYVARSK